MNCIRSERGIGRRELLGTAASVSASAILPQRAFAQTPKRGGHLVMGCNGGAASDNFDPGTHTRDFHWVMSHQVYDSLSFVNEKMAVVPWLAESWDFKDRAKTWIFKLRRGVTFHNGKSLTAADVVFSINRHRSTNSTSTGKATVESVVDLVASAPDEVTFKLSTPDVDFPYSLAGFQMMIGPEGTKWDGTGTGPFVLQQHEPGVRLLTKKNRNDWKSDRGYVDSVESVCISDASARLNGLLSGSLHVINRVPATSVKQIEDSGKFQIFTVNGSAHPTLCPLTNAAPYNNLDLRLALANVVDRPSILTTVYRGFGALANDHPIPAHMPEFNSSLPQRKADPDKAKFHLRKSGFTDPIVYTTAETAYTGANAVAEVVQAAATKAGFNFQINRVPNDGYYTKYWKQMPFAASTFGGRSTANILLTQEFGSQSGLNGSLYKNEKFDQLILASRGETDKQKRLQMYHDMQTILYEEAAGIIPVFFNNIEAGANSVRGYISSPVIQLGNYRAAENIWLDN